jgi:hypothetical protein
MTLLYNSTLHILAAMVLIGVGVDLSLTRAAPSGGTDPDDATCLWRC